MKFKLLAAIILISMPALTCVVPAQTVLQRFVVVAGANSGGADRPLLRYAAGFGPIIAGSSGSSVSSGSAFAGSQTATTAGGYLGAGVDVHVARSWSIGVNAGYHLMADFSRPIGGRANYNGFEAAVSFGWLFGKGYGSRP